MANADPISVAALKARADKALDANEKSFEVWFSLLSGDVLRGRWAEAVLDAEHLSALIEGLDDGSPPKVRLSWLEADAGSQPSTEFLLHIAEVALLAGEPTMSQQFAQKLLIRSANIPQPQRQLIVMRGYSVLGLSLLGQGDGVGAVNALMNSTSALEPEIKQGRGPGMRLAAALLAAGYRQAVLNYLDALMSHSWPMGITAIAGWKVQIFTGASPDFGESQRY